MQEARYPKREKDFQSLFIWAKSTLFICKNWSTPIKRLGESYSPHLVTAPACQHYRCFMVLPYMRLGSSFSIRTVFRQKLS
ncbi:hypothetical protein BBA71_13125 [Acetobacter pasteurianus]|nr:hypothetical protein BBA71_13125 [Acetobacter pasteurianus]